MKQLGIIALSLLGLAACQPPAVTVILKNQLSQDIAEMPVVIERVVIEQKLGVLEAGTFPLLKDQGSVVPQQLDDLDGDGNWDQIAILVALTASTDKVLDLSKTSVYPTFTQRTSVYLGVDYDRSDAFVEKDQEVRHADNIAMQYPMMYQMEGPAWENDKVGFRLYFDSRNGKDIYGKTTDKMTLHLAGVKGQNYHKQDDWGMDVLKVGNSLGAGAVAMMYEDSLVKLGDTEAGEYATIVEGPVRTIFEVRHQGWNTPVGDLSVTERITIWAGQYGYQEELICDQKDVTWVTGIVNKYADKMYTGETPQSRYIYTFDQQSENKDNLGMAVVVTSDSFVDAGEPANEGDGVIETYYVAFKSNETPKYYFVAGWEPTDAQFSTAEGFGETVAQQALVFSAAVVIE
ncbi:DUF4861 family protein [Reichenbachiella agariperforans]|uniref:DUF4861 family protein n=1 Tax=Reichenbachiella agariperforans TaxID=156994 RepID=UPI001C0A1F08|nr:DUF4861 family protein [Reichenbachiella agariperforans]MBU2914327.1 DUF4861 domain-containing protein [Reichenbachiella agariperforans]